MIGTVLWFDRFKGFGFAKMEDGQNVFLHLSQIISRDKTLKEGDVILFDVEVRENGLKGKRIEQAKWEG